MVGASCKLTIKPHGMIRGMLLPVWIIGVAIQLLGNQVRIMELEHIRARKSNLLCSD